MGQASIRLESLAQTRNLMNITKIAMVCLSTGILCASETAVERLNESTSVLNDVMSAPDKGIPQELLEKSECIVIVPGLKKAAFVVGGKYGKGFISCRRPAGGGWSAPAAVRVEGGSVGFQIGGSETDAIMLVMNKRGAGKLLSSKFTLGGDVSVAAGPVGRTSSAGTDAKMQAEILTYSRSRGVFAGVSLGGATLRPDEDTNMELYGSKLSNETIVMGSTEVPAAASGLIAALTKYSAHKE